MAKDNKVFDFFVLASVQYVYPVLRVKCSSMRMSQILGARRIMGIMGIIGVMTPTCRFGTTMLMEILKKSQYLLISFRKRLL